MKNIIASLTLCAAVLGVLTGCSLSSSQDDTLTEEQKSKVSTLQLSIEDLREYTASSQERDKVVELEENGSRYYFASDGKRYIFPTIEIYVSWFGEYEPEKSLPLEDMDDIPLGGNVTLKPGVLMQTPTDPAVYLVLEKGEIAAVTPEVLGAIYGSYADQIIVIPNWYFTNYTYADPITQISEFPAIPADMTIDSDKNPNE
jgi:hypothetical protein